MSTQSCGFMDYFDDELAAVLRGAFPNTLLPAGRTTAAAATTFCTEPPPRLVLEPPAKQRRTNNFSNVSAMKRASSAVILNFGNMNSPENFHPQYLKPEEEGAVSELLRNQSGGSNGSTKEARTARKASRVRPQSQAYDHITAERKRREHLSQLFVALSSIVPGLKKMDKTSVLGDAITYLKQLKERVKKLEEQTTKKTIESVALVKKHQIMAENEQPLPEIEAKVCNKTILLNILCEKRKGLLVKLLGEVEKLNLVIVNTSVASFGTEAFHVTIIAEMEKDFNIPLNDVVTAVRSSLHATA